MPPEAKIHERSDLFDYMTEICDFYRCELRIKNVINFTTKVMEEIIFPALEEAASQHANQS